MEALKASKSSSSKCEVDKLLRIRDTSPNSMTLLVNSFKADVSPSEVELPCVAFKSWEESTKFKRDRATKYATWRFEDRSGARPSRPISMVLLDGPRPMDKFLAEVRRLSLGDFPRLACVLIESSLGSHLKKMGFEIENGKFYRSALRTHSGASDESITLSTGLDFSARRPFKDEPLKFALAFDWAVRARFNRNLDDESLARIALGMAVIYRPSRVGDGELAQFRNGFLGRVKQIHFDDHEAEVECRDGHRRRLPLADLGLEGSPAAIKLFESKVRHQIGASKVLRRMQQLNRSFTRENRRNVTALKDRLEDIRTLLLQVGSSKDRIVVPLSSYQPGSISISIDPAEVMLGESC